MNLRNRLSTKRDKIFLGIVFLLLLLITAIFYLCQRETGAMVQVTVDGAIYGTYPLGREQKIQITDKNGEVTNELVIHDGVADMTEADCPDKLCVHQKAIAKTNETIVCLPNKVVVQIIGAKESELDSVAK